MTTVTGIAKILHERADIELKKAVHDIIQTTIKELNAIVQGACGSWASISLKNGDTITKYSGEALLKILEPEIIDYLQTKYREDAVKTFMTKVDTLHDQIDELRDEIQYQE